MQSDISWLDKTFFGLFRLPKAQWEGADVNLPSWWPLSLLSGCDLQHHGPVPSWSFWFLSSWPRVFLLVSFKMLKIYRMWIAWTYLKTTADKIKHILAEKLVYLLIVLACVQNFSNNLLCHTGALEFRLVASFKTCAFPGAALCFVITWELSDGFIPPQRQRGGNNVLTNKYTRACMRAHSCIAHIPSIKNTHGHNFLS